MTRERLTEGDLVLLEERYAPPEIPPCRVCGAELIIGKAGGGEPTVYHCSKAQPLGVVATKREAAWEHFRASEHVDRLQGGDSRVLDLIAEVRAVRGARP